MGQEVQEVCPVNGDQTSDSRAGKAATTVAVPVDRPAAQLVAPRQLVVVPLVVHDVDPPLVVTRYLPAAACVHVPPVKSVASLA